MIIFDIEWNNGCDSIVLDEILQIGALRLDHLGGKITGTFNACIRPKVHRKLGYMAHEVLDMQRFQNAQWDFSEAWNAFRQWCGEEKVFATWGNSDMEVLRRNCRYWSVPELNMDAVYDIQDSFSARLGADRRIALYRAAEYCGIPDCFDCHDALNDALYTAMIGEWLKEEELLLCAKPKRIARLSDVEYPRQPRRRIGTYSTEQAALNSRFSREMTCPVCGAKGWTNVWHYDQPHKYYTDFNCPEHGWFVCRLNLSQGANGQWHGKKMVPIMTEQVKRDFYEAIKENFFVCKTRNKKQGNRRFGGKKGTNKN